MAPFFVAKRTASVFALALILLASLVGSSAEAARRPNIRGQWEGNAYSPAVGTIQLHLHISRQTRNGGFQGTISGLGRRAIVTGTLNADGTIRARYNTRYQGQPVRIVLDMQLSETPTWMDGTVSVTVGSQTVFAGEVEFIKVGAH